MKLQLCYLLMFIPAMAFSQKADTLLQKLDSLNKKADTVKQENIIKPEAYNESTKIILKNYFRLLKSDFKQQIIAPFTNTKKDWVKVAKFGVVAGGLMFFDEPVQKQMVNWRKGNKFLTNASFYVTNTGGSYEAITLAAMATFGYAFKFEKARTTALLASRLNNLKLLQQIHRLPNADSLLCGLGLSGWRLYKKLWE